MHGVAGGKAMEARLSAERARLDRDEDVPAFGTADLGSLRARIARSLSPTVTMRSLSIPGDRCGQHPAPGHPTSSARLGLGSASVLALSVGGLLGHGDPNPEDAQSGHVRMSRNCPREAERAGLVHSRLMQRDWVGRRSDDTAVRSSVAAVISSRAGRHWRGKGWEHMSCWIDSIE